MLRNVARPLLSPRSALALRLAPQLSSFSSRKTVQGATEDEVVKARKWLASFNPGIIPESICDVSFSRSSGPGGQNVNKTSSKATLRVDCDKLLPLIPSMLHPAVRSLNYYSRNSDALIIHADDNRKQVENRQSCFARLYRAIQEAGEAMVPGETSKEQQERVRGLQRSANEKRIGMKKVHSQKKSSRRSRGDD